MSEMLPPLHGFRAAFRAMVRLALPVVAVQVGWMAMGVVDTIVVGHVSADAMAAVALGNLLFLAVSILGMGVLTGLDPVVAQAVGARDEPAVARGVQRGLVLVLGLTILSTVALAAGPSVAPGTAPARRDRADGRGVHACCDRRLPPLLRGCAGARPPPGDRRRGADGVGDPRGQRAEPGPQLGVRVRAPRSAGLWRGRLELGDNGSRWALELFMVAFSWRRLRAQLLPFRPESFALQPLGRILLLGAPIAGVFQVFDGTQVVSIGVLRGTGDTRTPMLVNVLGYWVIALPQSAWLGLRTPAGPAGMWWGLVVGLAVVALILVTRVRTRLRGTLRRVMIDKAPAGA